MQYKNTIEAIFISLDEIQKLVSGFGVEEEIRTIDIDLANEKLRHIYDLFLSLRSEIILGHTSDKVQSDDAEIKSGESENQNNVIEFNLNEDIDVAEKESNIRVNEEVESKEEPETSQENHIKTKAELESRVKPKTPESKRFLGDTLKKESRSINDELSQKRSPGKITEQVSQKPISSINSALGINEKFEIINNLFNGDKGKFESTMQVLNAASNFNEAYEYISNNLDWDMDSIYSQRILELVRRKLIVRKNDQ